MATSEAPPSRILVVQTSYLGDVVLSTPVFAALKRQWPAAALTVLVRPEAAPLLRGHPGVADVWVYDKRGADRGVAGLLRMARRVRGAGFDVAVGLQKSWRTALLLAGARVPLRAGFRTSAGALLYHRRARVHPGRHSVERLLDVLAPLGVPRAGEAAQPSVVVAAAARRELERHLQEAGVAPRGGRYVVLAPGSAWATKRWTADGYAAVARAVFRDGCEVIYVGAPGEVETVEAVRRQAGCGISLAGRIDTAVLAAVIEGASAVVCNDSAPMHLAQALGTPVVAVFGPTSPQQGFGPRRQPAAVVERDDLDCRPCSRHGGRRCPLGTHECMRGIEAGRVVAALAAVRAGAGAPGASGQAW